MLARLAELGQDVAKWRRVKPKALHGWFECSDGRLYHRVVAEKALEAWIERLKARRKGSVGNAKRWTVQTDLQNVDEALAIAGLALSALKPDSKHLKGLPSAIAQGSPGDVKNGRTRIADGSLKDRQTASHKDRKLEAIPTGYPSQLGDNLEGGEIVALPRVGAPAREGHDLIGEQRGREVGR